MIYATLLLFAMLVCMAHKRRRMEAQRWERRKDAAKWEDLPLRNLPRVRLAILTNKKTGETFELFDDNRDDAKLTSDDWTIRHCNQCDPANHFVRDATRWEGGEG